MSEFAQRRTKLGQAMQNNSVAILQGAKLQLRTSSAHYAFRQNNDFYYLTGFDEPDALCLLCKDSNGTLTYILFSSANDPEKEVWDGKKIGQVDACKIYGADFAYNIENIDEKLPQYLQCIACVYYPVGLDKEFDSQIIAWLNITKRNAYKNRKAYKLPPVLQDVLSLVHELRVIKSAKEIELMHKAASISAQAHFKLMQAKKVGLYEYQLEAIFNEYCLYAGARASAYNAIVAGGKNACTLHYIANDKQLKSGDLVLIDAGCEYANYASDITRTIPVNGKFTEPQRQIYELVLAAQMAGIAQVKPGNRFDEVQKAILEVMVAGMVELGLLRGNVKKLIEEHAYDKFYMHSSGHWLGLDVHDPGLHRINNQSRKLEPGMVLTVEPGIYIKEDMDGIHPKWLGIGVRIEDDVVVTQDGCKVLSADVPKTIAEIENA